MVIMISLLNSIRKPENVGKWIDFGQTLSDSTIKIRFSLVD